MDEYRLESKSFDRSLFDMEESVDLDTHIIATYYTHGPIPDPLKWVAAIALEASTGSWTPVPDETPETRRRHSAKVTFMQSLPDYFFQPGEPEQHHVYQFAFPIENIGEPQIPMLLSFVIGNISIAPSVKLVNLVFPKKFVEGFKGPKYGIGGLREILGVPKRPLTLTMIKPKLGVTPKAHARMFYEATLGGIDCIKDDELLSDPKVCPREERIPLCMEAADKVYEETGEKKIYFVNITDRVDRIMENAERATQLGANGIFVNYTVGLSIARSLAEDPSIKVPMFIHPDYEGVEFVSPTGGVSHLVLAKLCRLVGSDVCLGFAPLGKFGGSRTNFLQWGHVLTAPFYHIKPTMLEAGGGVHPGHVPTLIADNGLNIMIGAGGGVLGHPMGGKAGGMAFRQAIDAAMQGIPLEEAVKKHKELRVALETWGAAKYDMMAK